MKRLILISIFFIITLLTCKEKEQETYNADFIINEAIKQAGGKHIENSVIEFSFRNKHYTAARNSGEFQYTRAFKDSLNHIKDVLSNSGFQRFVNCELLSIQDSMAVKYSSSVNSVHYFSVLPFGLNDEAVNKEYIKKIFIKDRAYHKIKVTFNKENGGEDFEDVFVYWIDSESYKLEYLAYSYIESDGIGLRFREAYNERYVNGVRFVDYNNYKPKENNVSVFNLDSLYGEEKLQLLSKIKLEKIKLEKIKVN